MVEQIGRYDMGAEARLGLGVWAQVLSKMKFSKGVEVMGERYIMETLGGLEPVSGLRGVLAFCHRFMTLVQIKKLHRRES